ncbi:Glutathione S-transferase T3, partial [Linum perenne]
MSKRGPNWSMEEDEALCQSWCKVSCDGDIGNGQKIGTFWGRIKAAYKAIMPGTDRTEQSIESRYKAVGRTCSKWKGSLRKANAQRSSGQTEDDVNKMAKLIYKSETNDKAFKDEHCWNILSQCPKWHPDPTHDMPPVRPMGSQPKSFVDLDGSPSPNEEVTPTRGLSRPEGRDKQRARNKGKQMMVESLDAQTEILVEQANHMKERNATRAIFEAHKMEHQRRK